jgi:hypothetical protein
VKGPLTLAGSALLCLALLPGCRRRSANDEPPPTPPPPPRLPVDTTLPGELAEGKDQAFGVPLPRVMRVTGRFADIVMATGPAAPDQVANFFRSRVKAEKIETGPTKTVFSNVTVKSQPVVAGGSASAAPRPPVIAGGSPSAAPGSAPALIIIEVSGQAGATSLTVRSVPLPRLDDSSTPEERMRKLGLKPDGTLADPTHLR